MGEGDLTRTLRFIPVLNLDDVGKPHFLGHPVLKGLHLAASLDPGGLSETGIEMALESKDTCRFGLGRGEQWGILALDILWWKNTHIFNNTYLIIDRAIQESQTEARSA